ncbi:hypothetical protein [Candidatus Laterigemmans baculatus]|uniref:hypothetical protein n=1 Tax=Candidatus Laterigemmans baculatus TaxID=2770505 RepID=UPI0013D998DA|nr:hypothetical protein [Candidatus Laterigemmans baculatus]
MVENKSGRMSSIARRLVYIAAATLLVGMAIAIVVVVRAVNRSLVAEENFQAFFHAQQATVAYVEQYDGRWPRSWDHLRAVRPKADFDWVAEHVSFDFAADPDEVVDQTPETFTAIEPDRPCFRIDDLVQSLIDTLRKHRKID